MSDNGTAKKRLRKASPLWIRIRNAYELVFYPEIPDDAPPQRKWEALAEGPMLVVSVAFLILFTGAALGKTDARGTRIAEAGLNITWAVFIVDYVVRLILAKPRGRWFIRHLPELALVCLPWFRPLRVLRIVPVLFLGQRFSAKSQRVTVAVYTAFGSVLMILVSALSFYDVEYGQPDSHIQSFQDALWWAVVTVTTVGYGDIYPVTPYGRMVGVFLMISGIAVAGIVTATVAAWLVQQVEGHTSQEDNQRNLMYEIIALRQEIKQLREEVAAVAPPETTKAAAAEKTAGTTGSASSPPETTGSTSPRPAGENSTSKRSGRRSGFGRLITELRKHRNPKNKTDKQTPATAAPAGEHATTSDPAAETQIPPDTGEVSEPLDKLASEKAKIMAKAREAALTGHPVKADKRSAVKAGEQALAAKREKELLKTAGLVIPDEPKAPADEGLPVPPGLPDPTTAPVVEQAFDDEDEVQESEPCDSDPGASADTASALHTQPADDLPAACASDGHTAKEQHPTTNSPNPKTNTTGD